jgi:hypothetical protein
MLHDPENVEYYPLCRRRIWVVSQWVDGEENAAVVERILRFWNEALKRGVLMYGGMATVDIGGPHDDKTGAYIAVGAADIATASSWRKQRYQDEPGGPWYWTAGRGWQIIMDGETSIQSESHGYLSVNGPVDTRGICASGGRVLYDDSTPARRFLADVTIAHEIGHVLGFPHSKQRHTIMYPRTTPKTKQLQILGTDTMARLEFLYGGSR